MASVGGGGLPRGLFKNLGKIERIGKSRQKRDILYSHKALVHKSAGVGYPDRVKIGAKGDLICLLKDRGYISCIVGKLSTH